MAERLTRADRETAITALERIADEAAAIATWLGLQDEDRAAILLESAWRDISAAAWALERPVRQRPAGWLGAANGLRSG